MTFDETKPQKTGKYSLYDFDVSSVIKKIIIKDNTLREDLLKVKDIKNDKEDNRHNEEKHET